MERPHSLIASSSSSSSSKLPQTNYDVFLSFRGETRNNFTSHLCNALRQKGFHTFFDDDELERGKPISAELPKAIESSRCSVVILSGDYASSRWCLDELVKILECMKEWKQIVVPIFYHVDPSHVRKQIGSIGEAFQRHEQKQNLQKVKSCRAALSHVRKQIGRIGEAFQRHEQVHNLEKVKSWRAALTEVGNLAGYHLQDDGINEAKFIENFIKVVSSKLLDVPLLNISKDLVGMDSRLEKLELCISSSPFEDVRFVGICGMGGLGKTTLARAYFESLSSQFDASSFLANVREVCEKENDGLVKLQKQLLTDILKGEHAISNVYQGIGMITTRLCRKKVLVILDDVDQLKQLEGLAEKNNWFGYGSRIILTTRDESLLKRKYKKEGYIIHKVEKLEDSEALQLFSRNAFKSDCHSKDYIELSQKVVEYANGLPLALEVLGSFLGACESIDEWKSALERLKKYPEEDIMEKLQISFDALKKETEKAIFLDIACFFNGVDKDYVMNIMDSCGFFPEIGIRSLVDKSLLHMDRDNKLRMHDLLEEMGKKIVREKSCNELGRRSRIWLWDDFYSVMNNETGTEEVEAIFIKVEGNFNLRGFSNMKKLRLLIIIWDDYNLSVRGYKTAYYCLSKEIRFLDWKSFLKRLVGLKLSDSNIKQHWKNPIKPLYNLKSIDLTESGGIIKLEGFRLFPNLEKLILDCCWSLEEIDPSITVLKRLTLLSLHRCSKLISLPRSMDGLESLKVLNLSYCSRLGNLPVGLGNLEELDDRGTGLRDIPSSIGLYSLKVLNLSYCSRLGNLPVGLGNLEELDARGTGVRDIPSSIGLYSLKKLDLRNCRLGDGAFPDDFGALVSLKYLDLSGNDFSCLPACFNRLSELRDLDLRSCRNLTSLGPELPDSLESVTVHLSWKLHILDPLSQCNLRCSTIFCVGCYKLVNRQGSKRTAVTSLGRYLQSPPSPSKRFDIVLPGDEIPSWFTHQVRGSSSISLPLHPNWCTNKWMGFALSVFAKNLQLSTEINEDDWGFGPVSPLGSYGMGDNDHLWLLYLPRDTYFPTECDNESGHIEFSFNGAHLVYEQDIQELNLTATHEPIET